MKTKETLCLLAIVSVIIFTACQHDDDLVVYQPVTELSTSVDSTELMSDSSTVNEMMSAKAISSSLILNASSYTKIPSYFYRIDNRYKSSYLHLRQRRSDACSWTTYVTAVAAIANVGNVSRYEVSQSKVDRVMYKCEELSGSHDKAKRITTLESFAKKYDKQYVSVERPSASTRLKAIKEMLYHIYTYKTPFLVISTYYGSSGNGIGHYLLICSIDWTGDPKSSTVYYTDCTEGRDLYPMSLVLNTMNYNTLLNRMIDSPSSYNMLLLMPK